MDDIDLVTERNILWTAQCIAAATVKQVANSVTECIECGDTINPKRKAILPHTKMCSECASLSEKR